MDKGILKNVSINFIGLILPTFVSLVTVPAYIHALGVERYGVVSLVWTLIGYFGILDLGMSMAAQNHISKALASGNEDESARVFWSAKAPPRLSNVTSTPSGTSRRTSASIAPDRLSTGVAPKLRTSA